MELQNVPPYRDIGPKRISRAETNIYIQGGGTTGPHVDAPESKSPSPHPSLCSQRLSPISTGRLCSSPSDVDQGRPGRNQSKKVLQKANDTAEHISRLREKNNNSNNKRQSRLHSRRAQRANNFNPEAMGAQPANQNAPKRPSQSERAERPGPSPSPERSGMWSRTSPPAPLPGWPSRIVAEDNTYGRKLADWAGGWEGALNYTKSHSHQW